MKCKNKVVNVKGYVYNDASQQMRPCNFRVLCSNDEKGKTLSIDNGLLQFTIPMEAIAKYFEGNYKKTVTTGHNGGDCMARCLPNTWGAKFVKCPYYKKHDQHQIVCEGINDKSTTHIVFGADYDLTNYMHKCCNDVSGCRKCPLHDLLDRKYGDE